MGWVQNLAEELEIYSRLEEKLEKRFFGIFGIIGGLAAVIVALCGAVGTLMIQNFTTSAAAEFKAAKQMQSESAADLGRVVDQANEIRQTLEITREELLSARAQADSIASRMENLALQNVDISQKLFEKVSDILESLEAAGINLENDVGDDLTELTQLLAEARRLSETIPNSAFQVGIVAYRADSDTLSNLEEAIFNDLAFAKRGVFRPDERPSYLSATDSVLYYDDRNRDIATKISEVVSVIFGRDFRVMKGAGVGVRDADRGGTVIIHVVGS